MIRCIAAVARDWGIGKINKKTGEGELLFNIPADMMHFRKETTGKICVFGYNTYMSLPNRPLKNRVNVVLWDKAPSMDCLEGAITFSDFGQLLNFIKILAVQYDVYVCGGAGVYAAFLPYYDTIDLTFVDATDPDTTAFFPDLTKHGYVPGTKEVFHKEDGALGTNGYLISKQIWVKDYPGYDVREDCIIK